MRTMVAAPAHMEAHPFLRDVAQGVVERVDAQLGEFPIFRNVHMGVELPPIRQIRIVDLEDEPGVDDGLIFLMHSVSQRIDVGLVVRVILVLQPMLDGAGRNRGQKGLLNLHTLERRGEILDIRFHGGVADILDGHVAKKPHRVPANDRAPPLAVKVLREVRQVAAEYCRRTLIGVGRSLYVTAETLPGIVRKTMLPELAVVDDVDAAVDLFLDDLRDGAPQMPGENLPVVGLIVTLCDEHLP